ncbi:MAG: glycine-rich domain-containing protein [Opitutales bacterium]
MKKINTTDAKMPAESAKNGFSMAEALITLLIICVVAIASAPVITKKHKSKVNLPHGAYACYWNDDRLVAKYVINGTVSDGKVVYDKQEERYGCEFNPPSNAKNFVATIVGGGGGGAGAGIQESTNIQKYDLAGSYSFTTPISGIYQILAVGAGGGGGDQSRYKDSSRACTGSTGALVYLPAQIFPKGKNFTVNVGRGGSTGVATHYSLEMGGNGDATTIISDNVTYANAGGGGGGCSYFLTNEDAKFNKIKGYQVSSPNTPFFVGTQVNGVLISRGWEISYNVTSAPAGIAKSDIKNAKLVDGKRLGALNVLGQHQQYDSDYNMLSSLTDYSNLFKTQFNSVARVYTEPKNCRDGNWMNQAKCKTYSLHYGSGGGGAGYWADKYSFTKREGIQGYAGFVYQPVFAGLGGEAGKMTQIPYAEMPQKSLLFPGKGGRGGKGSNIYYKNASYVPNGEWWIVTDSGYVSQTAGSAGEPSYIKNGTQIYGGKGASAIDPSDERTYSNKYNDDDYMPTGGNGALADVLTNQKTGTGGLGGLSGANTSFNGLTQSVFADGALISGFNKIYGAGAGGGGGAVTAETADSVNLGNGGDGTSGLVFIQW